MSDGVLRAGRARPPPMDMRTGNHCLTPLAAIAGGVLARAVGTVCLDAHR